MRLLRVSICLFMWLMNDVAESSESLTNSFLDIDELHSTSYAVGISDHPKLLKSNKVEDDSVLLVRSKHSQLYQCQMPTLANDEDDLLKQQDEDSRQKGVFYFLNQLNGQCWTYLKGWWTYKFCYGTGITQYHVEADGTVIGDTLTIGTFSSEYDWNRSTNAKDANRRYRYHSQEYNQGDTCDLTDKPRSAEVQVYCDSSEETTYIARVDEPRTCRYVITVKSHLLCQHPDLRPAKEKLPSEITCFPALDTDDYQAELQRQTDSISKLKERKSLLENRLKQEQQLRERMKDQLKRLEARLGNPSDTPVTKPTGSFARELLDSIKAALKTEDIEMEMWDMSQGTSIEDALMEALNKGKSKVKQTEEEDESDSYSKDANSQSGTTDAPDTQTATDTEASTDKQTIMDTQTTTDTQPTVDTQTTTDTQTSTTTDTSTDTQFSHGEMDEAREGTGHEQFVDDSGDDVITVTKEELDEVSGKTHLQLDQELLQELNAELEDIRARHLEDASTVTTKQTPVSAHQGSVEDMRNSISKNLNTLLKHVWDTESEIQKIEENLLEAEDRQHEMYSELNPAAEYSDKQTSDQSQRDEESEQTPDGESPGVDTQTSGQSQTDEESEQTPDGAGVDTQTSDQSQIDAESEQTPDGESPGVDTQADQVGGAMKEETQATEMGVSAQQDIGDGSSRETAAASSQDTHDSDPQDKDNFDQQTSEDGSLPGDEPKDSDESDDDSTHNVKRDETKLKQELRKKLKATGHDPDGQTIIVRFVGAGDLDIDPDNLGNVVVNVLGRSPMAEKEMKQHAAMQDNYNTVYGKKRTDPQQ